MLQVTANGHLLRSLSLDCVHCTDGPTRRITSGHGDLAQRAFNVHHWGKKNRQSRFSLKLLFQPGNTQGRSTIAWWVVLTMSSTMQLHNRGRKKASWSIMSMSRTWCVGVSFGDVRCGELWRLLLAPDALLLLCHLCFYPPVVLLQSGRTFRSFKPSVSLIRRSPMCSPKPHLVVIVFKVRVFTLQLNHLQPGDPLLLLGRHQVRVWIPAIWFSSNM